MSIATRPPKDRTIVIGDARVTALDDGMLDVPIAAYQSAADSIDVEAVGRGTLADHGVHVDESANFAIPGCAFLICVQGTNILIDTGAGGKIPPAKGNGFVVESLATAELMPLDIDLVLMTHLHPDHVGGLVTDSGGRQFGNAQLMVNDAEWDYWHSDHERAQVPDFVQDVFDGAREATAPYDSYDLQLFPGHQHELVAGIVAIPLPGHTPGHTGYLISSQDEKLLIWGDIIHSEYLEFTHPDWSMVFDVDPAQAIQTRRDTMAWAAEERFLVAGMHLGAPAIGTVTFMDDAFAFVPLAE